MMYIFKNKEPRKEFKALLPKMTVLIALSHNSLFHNFCGWQVENIPVLNLGEKI